MDDALVKPVACGGYQALLRWLPGAEPTQSGRKGQSCSRAKGKVNRAEMPPLDFADPERQEEI